MSSSHSDSDWPTVTVVTHSEDLEPRLLDDAAVVASSVFAALRPDRLFLAWVGYGLLRFLGWIGAVSGIGDRMLPADPVEAWNSLAAGGNPVSGETTFMDGILHGLLIAAGVAVVALLGGALVRLDAERLGRDRDVTLGGVFRWALAAWRRLLGAVILPPAGVIGLALPAVFAGWLVAVPVLGVLVALVWFVPLVFAFAGGLVLVAWLWSLPLLVPAAAVESGDPMEVTVRVATLLRRRFPRMLLMLLVAILAAVPGWLVVSGVGAATVSLSALGIGEGLVGVRWPAVGWPALTEDAGLARSIVGFWHVVVISLVHAWVLGYVATALGRIFLVVRRAADRLPFEDLGEPSPE